MWGKWTVDRLRTHSLHTAARRQDREAEGRGGRTARLFRDATRLPPQDSIPLPSRRIASRPPAQPGAPPFREAGGTLDKDARGAAAGTLSDRSDTPRQRFNHTRLRRLRVELTTGDYSHQDTVVQVRAVETSREEGGQHVSLPPAGGRRTMLLSPRHPPYTQSYAVSRRQQTGSRT